MLPLRFLSLSHNLTSFLVKRILRSLYAALSSDSESPQEELPKPTGDTSDTSASQAEDKKTKLARDDKNAVFPKWGQAENEKDEKDKKDKRVKELMKNNFLYNSGYIVLDELEDFEKDLLIRAYSFFNLTFALRAQYKPFDKDKVNYQVVLDASEAQDLLHDFMIILNESSSVGRKYSIDESAPSVIGLPYLNQSTNNTYFIEVDKKYGKNKEEYNKKEYTVKILRKKDTKKNSKLRNYSDLIDPISLFDLIKEAGFENMDALKSANSVNDDGEEVQEDMEEDMKENSLDIDLEMIGGNGKPEDNVWTMNDQDENFDDLDDIIGGNGKPSD